MASRFEVRVYVLTGEIYKVNKFYFPEKEIPPYEAPSVKEEAVEAAKEAFLGSMENTAIDRVESLGLDLSPGEELMDLEPYRLYWVVLVFGSGVKNGHDVYVATGYHIDAVDGFLVDGVSVGGLLI
ncbi:hypothetical protein GF319_13200 [Candidatus Bathyarchaeota archaeon]|nr:hypothetical protein [Candidatus Bathyarchaeota archaeon]